MASKVLVVDDEQKIADVLKLYLNREGFQVLSVVAGRQAIEQLKGFSPDVVILDLNLPDMDGLEVCRTIRRTSNVPIIMLTGRGEEVDKILGLELGADDYVTKPFSPREIAARVKAVLRRRMPATSPEETFTIGDLRVDTGSYEAYCGEKKIDLTTTEFKILAALVRQPGRVLTRIQLLDAAQGEAYEGYDRTIDVHIKNIRQKIEAHMKEHDCRIETVRGVGYKFEVPVNEE